MKIKNLRYIIFSILVLLLIWSAGFIYARQLEFSHQAELRQEIILAAAQAAALIEGQLSRSLSATLALSSLIHQYGTIKDFDVLAAHMIQNYGGISSLQMAPKGVVSAIYPLAGNEKAIGHDLLKDPARRTDALKTIESKKLTLAGPLELIQGGVAVIGRLPVFLSENNGKDQFWGFTIVLIKLKDLLNAAHIDNVIERGYGYAISRPDPDTGEKQIFDGSKPFGSGSTIDYEFKVPNGEWTLHLYPKGDWQSHPWLPILYMLITLAGFSVSIPLFLFLTKAKSLRIKTKELVKVNQVLHESEERFRAITLTAHDGIITIDNKANIVFWNEAASRMFDYEENEVMGEAISMLIPLKYKQAHQKGFERTKTTGEHSIIGKTIELTGLRKNGEEFPLEMSLSKWTRAENDFFTGILRDISNRKMIEDQRDRSISDLQKALSEVKMLQGFLPICSHCRSIRDDKGSWSQIEDYIHEHLDAEFSHGICQKCAEKHYPGLNLYDE